MSGGVSILNQSQGFCGSHSILGRLFPVSFPVPLIGAAIDG
jgi:hypothetical protein